MTDKKLYTAIEVCAELNISYATLNRWYACKKQFPKDPFSKALPMFTEESRVVGRRWAKVDITQMKELKKKIKKGRNNNGKLTYILQQKGYGKKKGK